jgi:hypothetical protein
MPLGAMWTVEDGTQPFDAAIFEKPRGTCGTLNAHGW